MTTKTKICSKCGVGKPLDEFHKQKGGKDGKRGDCKDCFNEISRKYHREHREEINKKGREYYRKVDSHRRGHLSMYENKLCAQYLGVVIGERLCRHLFKDVEVMPYGNTGYDIICNKGKLIDVKTSSTLLQKDKYSHWQEKNFGLPEIPPIPDIQEDIYRLDASSILGACHISCHPEHCWRPSTA